MSKHRLGSSFRDPSGFVYESNGVLLRQVNSIYQENYNHLIKSGLYETLIDLGYLIKHQECSQEPFDISIAYKILQPEKVRFITYPYEWCFSQLKAAALVTLEIQKLCMQHGMSLKDANAYNIQFKNSTPQLIDILSFEKYKEGEPWVAYNQFCQHFLSPLSLMAKRDIRLNRLLSIYIDGIPLDLTRKLLPRRTRLNPSLLMHIHLHSYAQRRLSNRNIDSDNLSRKMNKVQMLGLIDNLETAIRKLTIKPDGVGWANYYKNSQHLSKDYIEQKGEIFCEYLDKIHPRDLWDFGANTGKFSRFASSRGIPTLSIDYDPDAVELNFNKCNCKKEENLYPLIIDLINPSPNIGWANRERISLMDRGPVHVIAALGIIHHLAISNNVPFRDIADFFASICEYLIIEFIPKSDSQVQILLSSREDIFHEYTLENFLSIFLSDFIIIDSEIIQGSQREIFLMKKKA